ncbi:hypothetical protein E4U60_005686 [Claviceps pazoutovae]|uniref:Uncharacterized protein n=1 Tax=Claviceps pazoutovae TaxID=1649127 RepID=A0A9P7M7G7_9HYPO|nr:hypothetical protein E4U60_005686 [Claviceps pazoutovae]
MVPTPCIQEKDQQIQEKDQQIQEKDQQIQGKEQELQNRQRSISLDHIEIPLKKILKELKAVDEDCIFFAKDVEITFELDTLVVIQKAMWHATGIAA